MNENTTPRFVWTRPSIEAWVHDVPGPRQTISAPSVDETFANVLSRLERGTPWLLVQGTSVLDAGSVGVDWPRPSRRTAAASRIDKADSRAIAALMGNFDRTDALVARSDADALNALKRALDR